MCNNMGCIALVLFTRAFGLRHVVSCKLYKHIWKRMTPSPPPLPNTVRVHVFTHSIKIIEKRRRK